MAYNVQTTIIMDCHICTETCQTINCQCGLAACRSCIGRYLAESINDPMCMACKRLYDYEFLISNLGKTWHESTYKPSRKTVLLDRERAKIPLAMRYLEHQRIIDSTQKQLDEASAEFSKVTAEYNQVKAVYMERRYHHLELKDELKRKMNEHKNDIERDLQTHGQVISATPPQLYVRCPRDACQGMLNEDRVCIACRHQSCTTCFETMDDVHTCDPDTVATIALIKNDTKPCPICSTPIHRITGCYQMWCTKCHATFHYATLEILHERVHNPHYLEWAMPNRDQVDRNVCDDARLYQTNTIRTRLLNMHEVMLAGDYLLCSNLIMQVGRIRGTFLLKIDRKLALLTSQHKSRDRVVQYIQNQVTEDSMRVQLYSFYKQQQRWESVRSLVIAFMNGVLYLIDNFFIDNNMDNMKQQIDVLVNYTNERHQYLHHIYSNGPANLVTCTWSPPPTFVTLTCLL